MISGLSGEGGVTINRRVARIVALLVLTGVIAFSVHSVDWARTGDALRQGRPLWLAMAVLANTAILVCWAAFWRSLRPIGEPQVGFGRMFEITATSSALMNTLPFGGGHASSLLVLIRRAKMSKRGAVSLFALDQLGEGMAKATIFASVALLVPLPTWMRAAITTASLVVAGWFVVMAVASRWARDLEIMKHWRRSATALACVLAMKAVEAVAIAAVQQAYGIHLPVGETIFILAAVVLATMLPIAPGNLGTYEAAVFLAYRYLGVSPAPALSLAIVQHICFMLPAVGVGYAFFSAQAATQRD
ncbi:MAG TPA: lysylphosphatidylglycerol synthase transmembrane domain-containing protein [Gemmatimonadaceae bacterium]|nr:lysylphosphatidylglycerol synthase transmembrane domain-containing protein [Gemmatimonadaceae bacterium]